MRVRAPERAEAADEASAARERAQARVSARRSKAAHLALCRVDVNVFAEYVGQDARTGGEIEQAPIHVKMHAGLDVHRFIIIMAFPESGKAVPLDTPIPVPTFGGFRAVGDLEVGDEVFDRRGERCKVTWTSPVQRGRTVYEVEFDDGAVERADADHRWLAWSDADTRAGRGSSVYTTREMLDAGLRTTDRWRWKISTAGAVRRPEACLPVHPYLLGAWLGDGHSSGPVLTFHAADVEVVERAARLEGAPLSSFRIDPRNRTTCQVTLGARVAGRGRPNELKKRLRRLGVIDDKHVPRGYLSASVEQRRELLAGLLDTDGSVSNGPSGGSSRIEFTSTRERLALDVLELARSLGFKASISEGRAALDGRDVGPKWRVTFTARVPVFRLKRKLERQKLGDRLRTRRRSIVAVREVESVPVRCIAVDSPDCSYLMGRSYTVTHNTSQIAILRTLFKLGSDATKRCLLLNEAQKGGSDKTLGAIKRYVEGKVLDSRGVSRLHEVFPNLRPGDKWTDTMVRVRGALGSSRDMSVQAIGYMGTILGSRLDFIVIDDLLTHRTTRTSSKRAELKRWLENSVFTRIDDYDPKSGGEEEGDSEIAFLTNAWHLKDAAHTLRWPILKFPVYDRAGEPVWKARWPRARVERARTRLKISALEFARAWMCTPKDPGAQIFSDLAIETSLRNGMGRVLVGGLAEIPNECLVVSGVDIAATKRRDGAKSAIATLLVHPNEDRQLLRLVSGRWGALELLRNIVRAGKLFPGSIVMVENNGVQQHIVELAQQNRQLLSEEDSGLVPIYPYTTGSRKADPTLGVEAMAGEMEAGGWLFPCSEGEGGAILMPEPVATLVGALEAYVTTDHTPDEIMALWFALEGARRLIARRKDAEEGGAGAYILG